jgi:acyl-homoserine-lactone acylase
MERRRSVNTPRGLADSTRAVESFKWAVEETKRRYGSFDTTWGDIHRVRRGKVDVPVGGCGNDLGCFRILGFNRDPDGKLSANVGDGWILAVEFGDTPRAYPSLPTAKADFLRHRGIPTRLRCSQKARSKKPLSPKPT